MKLLVYGGSFNPPHAGHVHAAEVAAEALQPDCFLLIPDYLPPHKQQAENSPSPEERLEMCRLAFGAIPGAVVSDMEILRGGKSYTVDTLAELQERYPGAEMFFVLGADMLFTFEQWHRFEEIFSMCTLVALTREENQSEELAAAVERLRSLYGAAILLLPFTPVPASSSGVRKKLAEGEQPDELPAAVYDYIAQNRLYGA